MKRIFIKRLLIMSAAAITLPAAVFAQKGNQEKNKTSDVQQIIITRKGNADVKTIIEINGEKVKVNGKDVNDIKDGDVTVNINKINGQDNLNDRLLNLQHGANAWNFNDNNFNLFSEDQNRAMLGVVTDESDKGAKISEVSEGSAAAKAGLKQGDIITKIDDKKIGDADDVSKAIHSHKPGEKVTITILRNDKEQNITTELGKWKGVRMQSFRMQPNRLIAPGAPKNAPEIAPMPFEFNDNDFSFEDRPKLGMSIQDTEDGKGVKVIDVDEDSNAGKAGIKEDDVITQLNEKEVNSADEISRIVRENSTKNSINFKVLRKGKTQNIEVHMPHKIKTVDL